MMHTTNSPTLLLIPLLAGMTALAQEPAPNDPLLPSESHLLQFERIILMGAPEGLEPTDFEIGKEQVRRQRRRQDAVDVAITFKRAARLLPVERGFVDAIVHSAETTPGSPWRLAQLTMTPASDEPDSGWIVSRLVFTRYMGGAAPSIRSAPAHEALSRASRIFATAAANGIVHRLTKVEFRDGRQKEASELRVDFAVIGERFRRGYVRIEKMFEDATETTAGPFAELLDARGERLLADPQTPGASYQVRLALRTRRDGESSR